MMIGPEGYYEVNLKGKTKQEILKKIRSLKREINQLKRSLEEHFLETEEMFPTRLTRLKCYRNYLDRAIRAYEEAGGRYIPTKAEQKSRDFDASLDSLQKRKKQKRMSRSNYTDLSLLRIRRSYADIL